MKSYTLYQQNGLKPFINWNKSDDIEINANLKNGDMNGVIGLIKSHTLPQFNEPSYFNEIYQDVENGDMSSGHYFMNSHTLFEANNHNAISSTKKGDENTPNVYEMEDTVLNYDVGVDAI